MAAKVSPQQQWFWLANWVCGQELDHHRRSAGSCSWWHAVWYCWHSGVQIW